MRSTFTMTIASMQILTFVSCTAVTVAASLLMGLGEYWVMPQLSLLLPWGWLMYFAARSLFYFLYYAAVALVMTRFLSIERRRLLLVAGVIAAGLLLAFGARVNVGTNNNHFTIARAFLSAYMPSIMIIPSYWVSMLAEQSLTRKKGKKGRA